MAHIIHLNAPPATNAERRSLIRSLHHYGAYQQFEG